MNATTTASLEPVGRREIDVDHDPATPLEVVGIALVFTVLARSTELTGVTAAVVAFISGRLAGNLYLIPPCIRVLAAGR